MKLLRHILSHFFLITFIIMLVFIFYYRSLLLPANVVSKIDGYINEVYPPALTFASKREYFWTVKGQRIVSFDDLNIFKEENIESKKEDKKTRLVTAGENKKAESNVAPENNIEVAETEKKDLIAKSEDVDKNPLAVVAEVDTPPPVVVEKVDTSPQKTKLAEIPPAAKSESKEETPVEVIDRNTSSERDLLISARNNFHHGNIKLSESLYLELTQLEQDNPDNFGELGNVYYSQGKWDEAGQAYYQAAVRLMSKGNYNQVAYLQRVINGLNAEYAEKLSQLMMSK